MDSEAGGEAEEVWVRASAEIATLRILSNLRQLQQVQTDRFCVRHTFLGRAEDMRAGLTAFFRAFRNDVAIFNTPGKSLLAFCLLKWLIPFQPCRLVSLDIVLSRPVGWRAHLKARLKRLLLRKVDLFINYFTDLEGYERYYGISRARSAYVPFKANIPGGLPALAEVSPDGEYVLTAGRSHRDLKTFVAAMRQLQCPAVLLYHDPMLMKNHGTTVDLSDLPRNVKATDYKGDYAGWVNYIRGAKLVVISNMPHTICATGISTYLVAMALCKCVIITEGPATRGLLSDQAIVVPPSDPIALAGAIRRAWEDDALRERTALAGRCYAEQLGDEKRLLWDIVNVCGELIGKGRTDRWQA